MKQSLWSQFAGREAGPLVQFVKYAICGGIATAVDMVMFYLTAVLLLPALKANDPAVVHLGLPAASLDDGARAFNATIDSAVAFIFSNFTAYVLNVLWVFKPGRHKRATEVGLFYLVSGVSLLLGMAIVYCMIKFFHAGTTFAYVGKVFASLMINYAGRKFLIFKG